jgi:hypothetical protein
MPCKPCNNGWMSDLEKATKAVLLPMARVPASRIKLSLRAQALLTMWIVKTDMVLEFANAEPYYTQDERTLFKETLTPPDHTWIWIGKYRGTLKNTRSLDRILFRYTDGTVVLGHLTTMSLGGFVFQVLSYKGGELGHWEKIPYQVGPWEQSLVRLWPPLPGSDIEWPPSEDFDDDGMARLAARFSGGESWRG